MSSRSSSPSIPSDNDSELSFSLNEDVPEIIEGEYDEKSLSEENSVREEEECFPSTPLCCRDQYMMCKIQMYMLCL